MVTAVFESREADLVALSNPSFLAVTEQFEDFATPSQRVERVSDLFNSKTFFDEPQFGTEALSMTSLPSLPNMEHWVPETTESKGVETDRVERLSDLFSRKTFLDEHNFGQSV